MTAGFVSYALYCPKCGAELQPLTEYYGNTIDQWNRCYHCGWESEHIKSVATYTVAQDTSPWLRVSATGTH